MQAARSLTPDDAAARLGVHYTHLMRLIRERRILLAPNGDVDERSLESYAKRHQLPPGHVVAQVAAVELGIPTRHIHDLVADGTLRGVLLPNAKGGACVELAALEELDRAALARAKGFKVRPPSGWLTSGQACEILACGRSTLRWLVARGLITQRRIGTANVWYSEDEVRQAKREQSNGD